MNIMSMDAIHDPTKEKEQQNRNAEDLVAEVVLRLRDGKRDKHRLLSNLEIGLGLDTEYPRDVEFAALVLQKLKKKFPNDDDVARLQVRTQI